MSRVIVIAQGGGPTAVINQTMAGSVIGARRRDPGVTVLGARYGVRGLAAGDLVHLSELSDDELMRIARTPSSALGSTRDKPDAAYCDKILAGLRKAKADAFIYIGGNDTAGTLQILDQAAKGEMTFIHAPKTIDNDLAENDHTPGFVSAALFVAQSFASVDLDFRSLPGIYVGIVMGRHAGFLTAAAAAWRRDESDGPHLVYIPEVPFSVEKLAADIKGVLSRYRRCVVAMSEGVSTEDGRPLAEGLIPAEQHERDAHGNLQLSGGDLGLALQARLKQDFPKSRARVDTFGYLPRGFGGLVSALDAQEAFDVGLYAAEAAEKKSGSVALVAQDGRIRLVTVDLGAVAGKTRLVPREFIDESGSHVTEACMDYFARLLPPRPEIATPFV